MASRQLHVALLSSPGMGHLIPVTVIGNHLATHHNIKVTVFTITTNSSPVESQILKGPSVNKNAPIDIVPIPSVDVTGLVDSTTKVFTQLRIIVRENLPRVRSAISKLIHSVDALIVDLFCTSALSIANELNIPKYVYHPSNAWSTALIVYTQILDKQIQGQYVDQISEPFIIPGCKPMRAEDVADPMMDRNDQQYYDWMIQGIEYSNSDGVLMNTWEGCEPLSIQALRENGRLHAVIKVPIYPIGPLIRKADENCKDDVMQWLDIQPLDSVLYVCFGSGGTLSSEQLTELAFGLELSKKRFVWVVRPPSDSGAHDGLFFTTGQQTESGLNYLPEGFLTRTQDVGMVIPMWAEQVEILSHPSIGGFLTHCGWNSIVESVNNGIPMIAWPLYAEQKMNATMLTEELGIAIRSDVLPTKKVVAREEIDKMVKKLILQSDEGKVMKEKVKKLKMSAENGLSKGGSSYNAMCQLLQDIETKTTTT